MRFYIRSAAVMASLFVVLSASGAKAGWYGLGTGGLPYGKVVEAGYVTYGGVSYMWFQHAYCTANTDAYGKCNAPIAGYNWAIPTNTPAFPILSAEVMTAMTNSSRNVQVGCNSCSVFTTTPVGLSGSWTFWVAENITLF